MGLGLALSLALSLVVLGGCVSRDGRSLETSRLAEVLAQMPPPEAEETAANARQSNVDDYFLHVAGLIRMFHYSLESVTWQRGTPHRREISFA